MTEPMQETLNPTGSVPELAIVTGMSGAGRTECMHVLEDLGFYCVDNLPSSLIHDLVNINSSPNPDDEPRKVAVVCDARNGDHFAAFADELVKLKAEGIDFTMIFLDANDDKLIARYKSSRRRHPMCADGSTILQGIQRERALMGAVRDMADYVIDTTEMLPQQLRETIREKFSNASQRSGLAVTVYSFGFKHGAPADADIVMDVRFLPNPYYDPELRDQTGLDAPVRDFVMLRDETIDFMKRWCALLDVVMPGYVKEGKQHLAIGVGCTGGQHRSVAIAERTGDHLKSKGYRVSVAHRDMSLATRAAAHALDEETPDARTQA